MIQQTFWQQRSAPYIFAIITSLLLSLLVSWQAGVINPDAVCYLLSAQTIGTSGLSDAMKLCGQAQWPFYSIFIYAIAQVTHLSFAVSAYLLDAVCSVFSIVFFMLIIEALGARQLTVWLAAFVVLLAHHFIGVREYIIRDHGFWAAYLASIYYLIRFVSSTAKRDVLYFGLSMVLATLFRIEGIVFLVLTPFITWFLKGYSFKQRCKLFIMLNLPALFLALIGSAFMLFHAQQGIAHISRLPNFYHQLMQTPAILSYRFNTSKDMLVRYVLPLEAASSAGTIWLVALVSWYILQIIDNLTPIYALLVLYACFYKLPSHTSNKTRNGSIVLIGFIVINVIITAGFFAEYFFLSKRYLMALSLVLMTFVPFALDHLLLHWQDKRSRVMYLFASFVIVIYALSAMLNFTSSKTYIHEAGVWLAQHVPADQTIFANDLQVKYYSNHFGTSIFPLHSDQLAWSVLVNTPWKQYDYVALRVNRNEQAAAKPVLDQMQNPPLQTYRNPRGDTVYIYKIKF